MKSLFAVLLLCASVGSFAQDRSPETEHSSDLGHDEAPEAKTWEFDEIAIKPQYPGGITEFYKYIGASYRYTEQDRIEKTTGTIYIKFIVNRAGYIRSVQILKGVNERLDNEAIRVLLNSKKWSPGKIGNKKVSACFRIPFRVNAI